MKGFVKMLEMILASIILLSSLSFFFSLQLKQTGWSQAMLETYGMDSLSSLDRSGLLQEFVKKNNFSESGGGLIYFIKKMAPKSVVFSVEMENIPRPNVIIGCNCNSSERARLVKILSTTGSVSNSSFSGREIKFFIDSENELSKLLERNDIDIIVFFNSTGLTEHEDEAIDYMDRGNSIIAITDMQQYGFDSYFSDLVGIEWVGGSPSGESHFLDTVNSGISRKITEYFKVTPSRIMTTQSLGNGERRGNFYILGNPHSLSTGTNLSNGRQYVNYSYGIYYVGGSFIVDGQTINIVEIDSDYSDSLSYVDIIIKNTDYSFYFPSSPLTNNITPNEWTVVITQNGMSSVQARGHANRNGNGRAIWIKNYNEDFTDINQLTKSLILWAVSDRFNLDDNIGEGVSIPELYSRIIYEVSGSVSPEPYTISLIMWYMF